MNLELHQLAKELFFLCSKNNISLKLTWIPREDNQIADDLSKEKDFDDWAIEPCVFKLVQNRFGHKFTLDPFADSVSNKCRKFDSKFWCARSSGVDGLEHNWHSEIVWMVPPIRLVSRGILHLRRSKARGVLIIPVWKSAAFWPCVHDGYSYRSGISVLLEFRKPSKFFVAGMDANDMFSGAAFCSNVVILALDFGTW
jgi:hypothetical protein